MNNNWCDFLLFVSAIILAGLAFVNELPNGKKWEYFKSLSFKFIAILIAVSLAFWGTRQKESNAKTETFDAEKKRDDENRKFTDESNSKIKVQLAKYGFELETQKNEIIKYVRDSAKQTNINVTKNDEPELDVTQVIFEEKKTDTLRIIFPLHCKKARASNIYLRIYAIGDIFGKPYFLLPDDKLKLINNVAVISDDTKDIHYFIQGWVANNVENFYFLLLGSYKGENKKEYPIKILLSFNQRTKISNTPLSPLDNTLYSFFKSKGVEF